MSREAMQLALAALESDPISHAGLVSRKQAITGLRQALVDANDASQKRVDEISKTEHEWVGLTDEQFNRIPELYVIPPHHVEMVVRAIEAKLKEKNT